MIVWWWHLGGIPDSTGCTTSFAPQDTSKCSRDAQDQTRSELTDISEPHVSPSLGSRASLDPSNIFRLPVRHILCSQTRNSAGAGNALGLPTCSGKNCYTIHMRRFIYAECPFTSFLLGPKIFSNNHLYQPPSNLKTTLSLGILDDLEHVLNDLLRSGDVPAGKRSLAAMANRSGEDRITRNE